MADKGVYSTALIDRLASLGPAERHQFAATLRRLSETLGEVPDGKTATHVLGVLAYMLDPS
jgi:hypothetical protein